MKWIKLVAKIALVLFILLITAHSVATLVLEYRVRAKIAAIRAKGEPASLADLHGKNIPDSENAAVIYEGLFGKVSAFWDSTDVLNSRDWIEQRETNPELWKDAGQAIARGQGIIDGIEVAASLPKCRFPTNLDSDGFPVFYRYAGLRNLTRLLSVNATYHAASGDMDEAVRSVELGFKLSESLKDDPLLIGYLARISLVEISSASLQRSLECGDISDSQAKHLFNLLADTSLYSDFENMIVRERVVGIEWYERLRREGCPKDKPRTAIILNSLKYRLLGTYAGRPFSYALELDYLNKMSYQIKIARLPYRKAIYKTPKPASEFKSKWITDIPRVFNRTRKSRDSATTSIAGSQILLALAAYKDRFGSYPENLDELRSALGWKLPEDPFSGRDFLYKLQGNGFLLYSVGLNLKDDGGTEDYIKINKNDREQADIIWRMAGDG